jgi:hypothetical protein
MTFLTPFCLFVALASLLPLLAALASHARTEVVRRRLRLPAPERATELRPLLAASAIALAGLAAAQPALTRSSHPQTRTNVQAVFVFDTSRSMAASATPTSPTRLDRAVAAAKRLRAAIADVPAGVATLTDRVLPDLLPVAGTASFDAVASHAVAIESPPPQASAVRATAFSSLAEIASGDYFEPSAKRRLVVLLTDGESNPADTRSLATALAPARGYRFLAVRFWHSHEAVYDADGKAEAAYRPDPLGRIILGSVAASTGGRALEESNVGKASAYLRHAAGTGQVTATRSTTVTRQPLAPYLAAVGLLLLALCYAPGENPWVLRTQR